MTVPAGEQAHGAAVTVPAGREARGADLLVDALRRLGVDVVFGLPGVHNLAIWRALAGSEIRLVGVRHEQTAAYAADGYARATGRLGVALVTTGPGAANTLAATGEAMACGSPVLVIATDIPTTLRRPGVYRGTLHETRDQAAMFGPVTRGALTVTAADEIGAGTMRAAALALAAPSGPVYLGLPTDLLSAAVELTAGSERNGLANQPSGAPPDFDAALRLIAQSRRPLVWAGGGALRAGAGAEVGELARRLAAPVITTYQASGLIAPDHPCAVAGPPHVPQIGGLWDEADLVIAIGSDLDGMMTQNWLMPQPPRLIAINIDGADAAKNYVPDLTLVGDARSLAAALAERVPAREGLAALQARLDGLAGEVLATIEREDPEAQQLLAAMRTALPDDATLVLDMCVAGYWLGAFHPVPAPRRLAYPVGWGTLGFAFPASLGTSLAGLGRAVCVCGDGGFLYACGELATAAQEGLAVTVVIVDDGGYGMLRFDQVRAGDEPFGVDLLTPDLVALAQAFGVEAQRVPGFGAEFADALARSMSASGPVVIVVQSPAMRPPPNTSPRWYRRAAGASAAPLTSR